MTSQNTLEQPQDLLPSLRALHQKTLGRDVQNTLKTLDDDARQEFVAQRMRLAAAVLHLETAALSELRQALEAHGEALGQGIEELTQSLGELEQAAQWAQGLGKVLSTVSMIVPAL